MKHNLFLFPFVCRNLQYEGRKLQGMNHLVEVRNLPPQRCWILCWNQPPLYLSLQWHWLLQQPREADGLDGWLRLPMAACPVPWAFQGPTFHLARDLWPWPCGQHWSGGGGACRYQAAWAQTTDERVSCFFYSSCSLVRSWELQNWYFSKSWLLTWLCRQAVLTVVHVSVCCTGGSALALSPSSATDWLWDFSVPLCLSGASVFLSGKQDSGIPAGAWAGEGQGAAE